MITQDTPIERLPGIGLIRTQKLHNLGIFSIRHLLEWYPFRYEDLTDIKPVAQARVGQIITIRAQVTKIAQARSLRRRTPIIEATLEDSSGSIPAIWYHQPFLAQKLRGEAHWIFHGAIALRPKKILQAPLIAIEPRIIPIYHETAGLNSNWFFKVIKSILRHITIQEYLPQSIIDRENLIGLDQALRLIHNPHSQSEIRDARRRLAFDELLFILLQVLQNKTAIHQKQSPRMNIHVGHLKKLVSSLPFKLTNAQRKAAWQIILDLQKSAPMNRLLQGDVGSGKTIVAALAALVASQSGYETIWLAPTEILVSQHLESLSKILSPLNIEIGMWTGSIKHGRAHHIWVGTHALLHKKAPISNVGLVIIDEQHRFGVQQRATLRRLKNNRSEIPHFLSMTATPIPRTLALTLYGDLDISTIDELPPGRQKVITRVIRPIERGKTYDTLRSHIGSGRQIYVVTPLIEEARDPHRLIDIDRKSAIKEYEHLTTEVFPDCRIGLLHGKLKTKEKQAVMEQFKNHMLDILVSTAVIEVGIDVPNATIIMIEDAEHFGLAQLHQLRGRVGRGIHQSYCFLFAGMWSNAIAKRLKSMEKYDSGFKLAEIDLRLRGPGELVGIRQSGFPDLKMASLTDTIMVGKVRQVAQKVIKDGLEKYPTIQQKLAETLSNRHLE